MLRLFAPRFRFLDPGPLVDGGLELVAPEHRWADLYLRSSADPRCAGEEECQVSPRGLAAYLDAVPSGHTAPDSRRGRPAAYQFWMKLDDPETGPRIAGTIALRVSDSAETKLYYGHIGYLVFPPSRGCGLAERAARLILPLARRHGLRTLWITTNPDNTPSRRTCERLGASYVETVELPAGHPLWMRGDRFKCRYQLDL